LTKTPYEKEIQYQYVARYFEPKIIESLRENK